MSTIIVVPVKPYIGHYLRNHYKSKTISDAVSFENCELAKDLKRLIEDPSAERDKRINMDYFKFELKVELTERVVMRNGFYLTRSSIVDFNTSAENEIKLQAHSFIDAFLIATKHAVIKDAIEACLKHLSLGNEYLPFDTLKKSYYRYRRDKSHHLTN